MNLALIRLLHLSSPTLPVGAYTYSQGLEWAVESGAVKNEADAGRWIGDGLEHGIARFEAVYLAHMLAAWGRDDRATLAQLDAEFIASRETAELRAETLQMGHSLARLLGDLAGRADTSRHPGEGWGPVPEGAATPGGALDAGLRRHDGYLSQSLDSFPTPSFPLAWSGAAAHWGVAAEEAVAGYLWAWAENQVMAAIKAVPLGQTAGQRLLLALGERLPDLARAAVAAPLAATHNYLPAYAIASSRHETQYTRIFRS